jgi:hypothetical protein
MNLQSISRTLLIFAFQTLLARVDDILLIVLLGTLADCHDFQKSRTTLKTKEYCRTRSSELLFRIRPKDTLQSGGAVLKPSEVEKSLRSACKILETIDSEAHPD